MREKERRETHRGCYYTSFSLSLSVSLLSVSLRLSLALSLSPAVTSRSFSPSHSHSLFVSLYLSVTLCRTQHQVGLPQHTWSRRTTQSKVSLGKKKTNQV